MTPRHKTSNMGSKVGESIPSILWGLRFAHTMSQIFYMNNALPAGYIKEEDISDSNVICPLCASSFLVDDGEDCVHYICNNCPFEAES